MLASEVPLTIQAASIEDELVERRLRILTKIIECFSPTSARNEKRAPGCLVYIGDDKLPSYIAIVS